MNERPLSALPSRTARVVAFSSVLVAGLAGGTIGYALVDVQCTGDCAVPTGVGMLIGSVGFALGMSVVAVLGLRAVGEWRERNSPDATDSTR
jgi:formate/nitrite transporter FocA (FNT family)